MVVCNPRGKRLPQFWVNHIYLDFFNQEYGRKAWSKRLGIQAQMSGQFIEPSYHMESDLGAMAAIAFQKHPLN